MLNEEKNIDKKQERILSIPSEDSLIHKYSKNIFTRIAFLDLSSDKKEQVAKIAMTDAHSDKLYWIAVVLSGLIATFGLLQNSVAVIIGAMLIAPLLSPIQSIAFGISTGRAKIFRQAFLLLIKSILIYIFFSFLFAWLIPSTHETSEIIARTAPNLLDFFIAVFSGMIAFLSLGYQRLASGVAGVAMAASLAPPLAVVGIEIALGNFFLAWGSFMLFLTNLFAILLVGTAIFFFFGFSPHQEKGVKRARQKLLILLISTIIISVPLFSSLLQISQNIKVISVAQTIVEQRFEQENDQIKVSNIEILKSTDEKIVLSGTLIMPENTVLYAEVYQDLEKNLAEKLQKNIELNLNILRTANLISKTEEEKNVFEDTLKQSFKEVFYQLCEDCNILQLQLEKIEEDGVNKWVFKTSYAFDLPQHDPKKLQQQHNDRFAQMYPYLKTASFWVPIEQSKGNILEEKTLSFQEKFHQNISLQWESYITDILPENASIKNISVSWEKNDQYQDNQEITPEMIDSLQVNIELYIPYSTSKTSFAYNLRKYSRSFKYPVNVSVSFLYFDEVSFSSERIIDIPFFSFGDDQ